MDEAAEDSAAALASATTRNTQPCEHTRRTIDTSSRRLTFGFLDGRVRERIECLEDSFVRERAQRAQHDVVRGRGRSGQAVREGEQGAQGAQQRARRGSGRGAMNSQVRQLSQAVADLATKTQETRNEGM